MSGGILEALLNNFDNKTWSSPNKLKCYSTVFGVHNIPSEKASEDFKVFLCSTSVVTILDHTASTYNSKVYLQKFLFHPEIKCCKLPSI